VGELRVGWFANDPRLDVSAATHAALARASDALRDAGAQVIEVQAPWDEDPTELFFGCVAATAAISCAPTSARTAVTPALPGIHRRRRGAPAERR